MQTHMYILTVQLFTLKYNESATKHQLKEVTQ